MVSRDDAANVLKIKSRRERGRADEVAKHDCQLAALGGVHLKSRVDRSWRN